MTIATLDAITTPVIGGGLLYVVSQSSAASSEGYQGTFEDLLERFDEDGDTRLSAAEVPDSFISLERSAESAGDISLRLLFQYWDTNRDDALDGAEWRAAQQFRARFDNALIALRPGGRGELPPEAADLALQALPTRSAVATAVPREDLPRQRRGPADLLGRQRRTARLPQAAPGTRPVLCLPGRRPREDRHRLQWRDGRRSGTW